MFSVEFPYSDKMHCGVIIILMEMFNRYPFEIRFDMALFFEDQHFLILDIMGTMISILGY